MGKRAQLQMVANMLVRTMAGYVPPKSIEPNSTAIDKINPEEEYNGSEKETESGGSSTTTSETDN